MKPRRSISVMMSVCRWGGDGNLGARAQRRIHAWHGTEEGLGSMARSARRAAGGFRNIGRFETMVLLRSGCQDFLAHLAVSSPAPVSNILPLESPPRVSIAPLTVDLRRKGGKKGRSSPLHLGRLQSHSSRCRAPLAEELYERHPVVSVQPPRGFGTQVAEQLRAAETAERGKNSASAELNRRSARAARFLTRSIPFSRCWSSFLLVPFGHAR